MEIIRILEESRKAKTSVRRKLGRYGISNETELTQPLAEMQPETALRLMLNWLILNAKSGHEIQLRVKVPEEQMVYMSSLMLRHGTMYVRCVHIAPELRGKILYKWDSQTTYETLTIEEIQRSIKCANALNDLQECRKTMRGNIDNSVKNYLKSHPEEGKDKPTTPATVDERPTKPPKIMKQPSIL